MRWEDERQSENVEDRRGHGRGFGRMATRRGGIGIGAIVLALLGGWLLGINPLEFLGLIGGIDGGCWRSEPWVTLITSLPGGHSPGFN